MRSIKKKSFIVFVCLLFLFTTSAFAQPPKRPTSKYDSKCGAVAMTIIGLQMEGHLTIEEYTSDPTILIVNSSYWRKIGIRGKESLIKDLITYFQCKQLEGRYEYVTPFVLLDKSSKEKLAQGNLITNEIKIIK